MHGAYVGGDMANPRRAALDPIFFSFHAYIDLVFQFWLDQHGATSITSPKHFLRATQPSSVKPPPGHMNGEGLPSMGQAAIYLDLAALGVAYDVTADDRLPSRDDVNAALVAENGARARFAATERSRHARLAGDGVFDPRVAQPTVIAKTNLSIPTSAAGLRAAFRRPDHAADLSFAVDFFLHPSSIELDLASRAEREKYIVAASSHWGKGDAHGHDQPKPLSADLSEAVNDLVASGRAGESWTVTAVVSGPPPSPDFGTLSLVR